MNIFRVTTLNLYWFGLRADLHGHLTQGKFLRDADDDRRLGALIASLDADLIALEEVVEPAALEALLVTMEPSWRVRDVAGEFVSNAATEDPQVVWAWRSDRVDLLRWTRIPKPESVSLGRGHRAPVLGVFRHRASGLELACVVVHAKSGAPQWLPGPNADAEKRVKQFVILREWLDAAPENFVRPMRLVTGDFNSLADSTELRELITGSMADWSVLTPTFKPVGARRESTLTDRGCVIDHFVVSPELRSLLKAAPEVYAFDEDPAFLDDASPDARVWKRTTDHRPVTLTIASDDPAVPVSLGPLKLTLFSTEALPGADFSGVVSLGDGTLLLAHDDDGVYRWRPGSEAVLLRGGQDHPALRDIEGLCYDEQTRTLYTLSEDEGVLLAFEVVAGAEATLSPAREVARLHRPGSTPNKGWEGLAVLPARFRKDGVARLIAVHEGAPKAVAVYALPGLELRATVALTGELDAALGDVADVAVCPDTGNLLLLSDQSEALAEVELAADDGSLRMVSLHTLPVANKAKPEGVTVTADGQLLVVTDQSRELLRFAMAR